MPTRLFAAACRSLSVSYGLCKPVWDPSVVLICEDEFPNCMPIIPYGLIIYLSIMSVQSDLWVIVTFDTMWWWNSVVIVEVCLCLYLSLRLHLRSCLNHDKGRDEIDQNNWGESVSAVTLRKWITEARRFTWIFISWCKQRQPSAIRVVARASTVRFVHLCLLPWTLYSVTSSLETSKSSVCTCWWKRIL